MIGESLFARSTHKQQHAQSADIYVVAPTTPRDYKISPCFLRSLPLSQILLLSNSWPHGSICLLLSSFHSRVVDIVRVIFLDFVWKC